MRSTHNRGVELTNDIRLHSQDKNKLSGLHRRFREQTWPLINRFSKKVTGHIIGGRWDGQWQIHGGELKKKVRETIWKDIRDLCKTRRPTQESSDRREERVLACVILPLN